ncbi:prolow-density lipoprotein receptor-related protein 1-like isoform X1 [Homalodisca vitripennis]|uniref:prolow-density lipoprotein receptor-related protein 1-like isoform X1 n=1 Tax=Homalodisca vitripennis TaxID=197043 RepID=UPI001EEB1E52|nr:prolow-density lipoprotein receptor-related protein 1-like isoform X1 [Homalodisca vitripennis]
MCNMWLRYTSILFGFLVTAEPTSVRLMYGESHGISWTDLDINDRLPPLVSQMYMDVLSIDYHYQRRCLFYSGWGNIWSLPIEKPFGCEGIPRLVVEDGEATSLAVDWVQDRIYWTRRDCTVWRADLPGINQTLILNKTVNFSCLQSLVLDPYSRFLFLAADGNGFFRMDLDGGGLKRIQIEGRRSLQTVSLALDTGRKRLYLSVRWDSLPNILSCDYDGTGIQDYRLSAEWWNIFISIGVLGDQLFWAHRGWDGQGRDTVWKANVSEGGGLTWLKEYTAPGSLLDPETKIWTLKVYHPEVQMEKKEMSSSSCHRPEKLLLLAIMCICICNLFNYNYNVR